LGSKLTGQQREPFLLVSPRCRSAFCACCFDGANGNGHAGFARRFPCRYLCRPCRERLAGAGQFAAPVVAHPRPLSLRLLLRGLVLGGGFASAEPAHSRESAAGSGFVLNGSKMGRTVLLCLLDEWPGDLGTHLLGGVCGCVDCGGELVA